MVQPNLLCHNPKCALFPGPSWSWGGFVKFLKVEANSSMHYRPETWIYLEEDNYLVVRHARRHAKWPNIAILMNVVNVMRSLEGASGDLVFLGSHWHI